MVRLAQCSIVRELEPRQYLTVSIPRIPPVNIKGIRVANRSSLIEIPVFERVNDKGGSGNQEMWKVAGKEKWYPTISQNSDIPLYEKGYIVIVPMVADEINYSSIDHLQQKVGEFPEWRK